MAAPAVQRAYTLAHRICGFLGFLPPLVTRVTLWFAFWLTGAGKIANIDGFTSYLTELGVPQPHLNALVVSRIEYWGAWLLLIGLGTRVTAAVMAGTMVVALLTADKAAFLTAWQITSEAGPTDIASYVFLMLLMWVAVYGPGVVSLDAILARATGLRRETALAPAADKAA